MSFFAARSLKLAAISAFEGIGLPDQLARAAIHVLVSKTRAGLPADGTKATRMFALDMQKSPIATYTGAANRQHYELPPEFFAMVLGPRRKYSCCLYDLGATSLAEAELHALQATLKNAELADGQHILDLGCGWGALSLFLAEHLPASSILAVSNSHSQRAYVEAEALRRGYSNLQVVTADVNIFQPDRAFDRIVSVEMFEHVANWPALLERIRTWLSPGGSFFMHVFSHARVPYRFDHADPADWIAQHFFTGGLMPSHQLIREFGSIFEVVREWRWSGRNYELTANDWLANFVENEQAIARLFAVHYGEAATVWMRRWRLFFLATAGLFGHGGGSEWGVSHYLLQPVAPKQLSRPSRRSAEPLQNIEGEQRNRGDDDRPV